MTAIYTIINKITGKQYVGSAKNFYKRKALHLRQLKNNTHHSRYLQRSWNKHGENMFEFMILEKIEDISKLIQREQWWIDNTNSEYNICRIANSSIGVKRSEETKKKIGLSKKGFKHTEETKKRISESESGDKHYNFGKKLSDEICLKKSESMKNYYKSNENLNKKPVEKLDLNGKFIEEFKSITEAGNNCINKRKAISRCLNKKSKTSGGFKWRYKQE